MTMSEQMVEWRVGGVGDLHCRSSRKMTSGWSLHARLNTNDDITCLARCSVSTAPTLGTAGCVPKQ